MRKGQVEVGKYTQAWHQQPEGNHCHEKLGSQIADELFWLALVEFVVWSVECGVECTLDDER